LSDKTATAAAPAITITTIIVFIAAIVITTIGICTAAKSSFNVLVR
jgi:hypothetical protein